VHARRHRGKPITLGQWPIERPRNWTALLNAALDDSQLTQLRTCVNRGRPCGDTEWVRRTARRLDLLFTLRDPGRPRKIAPK
jgi:putative transposase